jgi:hypothetical protein
MKNTFKVGDKVRRTSRLDYYKWVEKGYGNKIMTVTYADGCSLEFEGDTHIYDKNFFTLVEESFDKNFFTLVEESFEEKVVKAYKMIGTTVHWKSFFSGELNKFKVKDIRVTPTTIKLWNYEGSWINYDEVVEKPNEIEVKLNESYNATVREDTIRVGCQTFPISIIDDLVKAKKELSID